MWVCETLSVWAVVAAVYLISCEEVLPACYAGPHLSHDGHRLLLTGRETVLQRANILCADHTQRPAAFLRGLTTQCNLLHPLPCPALLLVWA